LKIRYIIFAAVAGLLIVGITSYLDTRLIEPLGLPYSWHLAALAAVILPVFGLPLLLILHRYVHSRWFERLLIKIYVLLGLLSFLLVLTFLRDLGWLILMGMDFLSHFFGAKGDPAWPVILSTDPDLRLFLLKISTLAIIGISSILLVVGIFTALRPPRLERIQIPSAGLHPDLEGYRIALISDVHLGPINNGKALTGVVQRINALEPDIVAITGDLADGMVVQYGKAAEALSSLEAPVYFVTGNHEYYWDEEAWIRHIQSLGVQVLAGDHRIITKNDANLIIAGVSDLIGDGFHSIHCIDPQAALNDAPRSDFRILLAHQPGSAFDAAKAGFDLQLSGHTHGGQFFPWNILIHKVQPFAAGLYRHNKMWIYTTRGTGFWGPPVRLGVPSEITLLELRAMPE